MRKVPAMCKIQSHEFVARIQDSQKNGCVSLCSGMRLYVCPFGSEDFFQAVDSDLFALVYNFTTSVIAFARITFCVLVSQARTHCLHYLVTYKVFRCNQLDTFQLTLVLFFDDVEN